MAHATPELRLRGIRIFNELDPNGVLHGNSMSFSIESTRFQDIIKKSKMRLNYDSNEAKINMLINTFDTLNKDFEQSIDQLNSIYEHDYSMLFFSYITPETILIKLSEIDEEKYYYFFKFLRNRSMNIDSPDEQLAYELFCELVSREKDKLLGLKFFYLKDYFIEMA